MPSIKNERGAVLVMILITMAALLILGTALNSSSVADMFHAARQENKTAAYYLARSGADAAAAYILENPEELSEIISYGPDEGYLDDGKFKVEVKEEGGLILIESTGYSGNYEETVVLTLVPLSGGGPIFDLALFAEGKIELTGSSEIEGNCATNSTQKSSVDFGVGEAKIVGDLYIGIGGNPNEVVKGRLGLAHVSGKVEPLREERSYTLPPFPAFPSTLPDKGDFTAGWWPDPPPCYILEDGQYNDLIVNSTLIIDVGHGVRQIRAKRVIVQGDGKVEIQGEGILSLYVEQEFIMSNGAGFNRGGDTNRVMLYYKGTKEMGFTGDVKFYGCLYSDRADIKLVGSSGIMGNIISGGAKVALSGDVRGIVRAIYAPHAQVVVANSSQIEGAVICNNFRDLGDARVIYHPINWDLMPLPETGATGLAMGQWKKK